MAVSRNILRSNAAAAKATFCAAEASKGESLIRGGGRDKSNGAA
jgi:hypothetical protein